MKFIALLALTLLVIGAVADDKVTQFPGWPANYTEKFQVYSGLLNVSTNRSIHYIFVESAGNKEKDPVILWLNGGPGCSSFLGMMQEIGPFVWEDGTQGFQQTYNQYSWNNNASLLFFESPPGVGFSENNDTNYTYTDNNTAVDNYAALQLWFSMYSQYNGRELWIAGESYAGIYVPFLANQTLYQNSLNTTTNKINLKGILVGNGVTATNRSGSDTLLTNEFFSRHKFVSPQQQAVLTGVCSVDPNSASCIAALEQLDFNLQNINPYNVYGYCYHNSPSVSLNTKRRILQSQGNNIKDDSGEGIPCVYYKPIEEFVNQKSFKEALHVNSNVKWTICANLDYNRDPRGSYWTYSNLIENKLKIVIYSGDTDAVVPFIHTQEWISYLSRNVVEPWRPWYVTNQQIGGYVTLYDGLSFVTVRGAGHMVPQWRREAAFKLVNTTLNGGKL